VTALSDRPCPVRLIGVCKWFEKEGTGRPVLNEVSFCAEAGRLHLLLGPSGSGKTTLLTMMAGLQRPTAGHVVLFGRPLAEYSPNALQQLRARSIGFVFQDFQLIDSLAVHQNIALVLKFAGHSNVQARRRAGDLLEQFGIGHLRKRWPASLSQGEKQRVAVARAVANRPGLVIADEPTASLESTQGLGVIHLLRDYARLWGQCVIVASHDLRLADYADTVQRLDDGNLRPWDGSNSGSVAARSRQLKGRSQMVHASEFATDTEETDPCEAA
jgi:putative ABC transport system ATP-binding protein